MQRPPVYTLGRPDWIIHGKWMVEYCDPARPVGGSWGRLCVFFDALKEMIRHSEKKRFCHFTLTKKTRSEPIARISWEILYFKTRVPMGLTTETGSIWDHKWNNTWEKTDAITITETGTAILPHKFSTVVRCTSWGKLIIHPGSLIGSFSPLASWPEHALPNGCSMSYTYLYSPWIAACWKSAKEILTKCRIDWCSLSWRRSWSCPWEVWITTRTRSKKFSKTLWRHQCDIHDIKNRQWGIENGEQPTGNS